VCSPHPDRLAERQPARRGAIRWALHRCMRNRIELDLVDYEPTSRVDGEADGGICDPCPWSSGSNDLLGTEATAGIEPAMKVLQTSASRATPARQAKRARQESRCTEVHKYRRRRLTFDAPDSATAIRRLRRRSDYRRSHTLACAGCTVSRTTSIRSARTASRSTSSRSRALKVSSVRAASYRAR
jgi:hypothetical protein